MGILSGIKAMLQVQKIANGGFGKLSVAQITNLIINLPDARRNLSSEEFEQVYALYCQFSKEKTKEIMDEDAYTRTCNAIIMTFNQIAPYSKYSGE